MTSSKKFPKRNGNQNVLSHPVTVGLEVKGKGKRDERYIRRLHSTRPLQESETVVTCAASDTIQTNRYVILLYTVYYPLVIDVLCVWLWDHSCWLRPKQNTRNIYHKRMIIGVCPLSPSLIIHIIGKSTLTLNYLPFLLGPLLSSWQLRKGLFAIKT